ncbi:hypothetical protein PPYR_15670 [Photinus pyralis]|uniref:Uncharacterized protein n=1 Tax=Photinus pyralis TaxID=7054 RepID=A0A5N4A096_PHOPY|nr:hypothetical protein PPYR_15670 [Photinus pyralis]
MPTPQTSQPAKIGQSGAMCMMMMSGKPQLRGLLQSSIKRNLIIAIGTSIVAGITFKTLVGDARKKKYLEFYKNYDIDKEFNEMRNKGVFSSCAPDS